MSRLNFGSMLEQRPWTPEEIERLRRGEQVQVQNNAGMAVAPDVFRRQEAAAPTGIVSQGMGPQFPAADRTVTVRGFSPSLGSMSEASYDFSGNNFLGGRAAPGGEYFRDAAGLEQARGANEFAQAIARGRLETGEPVPSASFLASRTLGQAMPGGAPNLEQERMQAALALQTQAANRSGLLSRQLLENQGRLEQTEAAVGGKVTKPEEKAALAAQAAIAQAIQRDASPEEASDIGRRMYGAMQSALPGLVGGATAGDTAPGVTGQSMLADRLLNTIMPRAGFDPKSGASTRAFDAASLAKLDPSMLSAESLPGFSSAARLLKPEQQDMLRSSLARQLAEGFFRTMPAGTNPRGLRNIDLEGLGSVRRSFLGGWDQMTLPPTLGGKTIPLEGMPSVTYPGMGTPEERAMWQKRYANSAALLRALAAQQQR